MFRHRRYFKSSNMKRKLLFILLIVSGFFVCKAQEGKPKEVSPEERVRGIVDHISKKIPMTKGQKDSVSNAYLQFIDDVQKYNAQDNPKVIELLVKSRDDKVKKILRDDKKFDQYLLILAEMKKQMDENRNQPMHHQRPPGGQKNPPGGGMPGGGGF